MMQAKIALLAVSVIFLLFGLLASFKHYKAKFHNTLSIKSFFPFEINFKSKFSDNLAGNILILLSGACLLAFFIIFDSKHTDGYLIFTLIAGTLATVLGVTLFFLPTLYLKTHILTLVIVGAFAFLLPCSLLIDAVRLYNSSKDAYYIIVMVLASLVLVFVFILLMNPRLSFKIKPDEIKNTDGTVTYARPKMIWIAFTEWMLIFSIYIIAIITFILSLNIK